MLAAHLLVFLLLGQVQTAGSYRFAHVQGTFSWVINQSAVNIYFFVSVYHRLKDRQSAMSCLDWPYWPQSKTAVLWVWRLISILCLLNKTSQTIFQGLARVFVITFRTYLYRLCAVSEIVRTYFLQLQVSLT